MLNFHSTSSPGGLCPTLLASLLFGVAVLGLGGISGCTQPAGTAPNSAENNPGSGKTVSGAKAPKKGESRVTTRDGKKYIDDIPYDVWYDDPLAVVENSAAVTPNPNDTVAATSDPANSTPEPKTETKPAGTAAAGGDWAAYIATDQLLEESKRIRNQLKTLLQTQAAYNADFEVIKMNGAVMAAMSGVVTEAGDGVNWKANAPYIRDYGAELVDAAKGLGKPNFDKTKATYENLQSVFEGSIPPGAAEPAPQRPFAEVASRFYLMKRMKLAFDAMKSNINTEAKLKSDQEPAIHEAMVLSVLSKIILLDGYSSADEGEYQQFGKDMVERCLEAAQAVKDQDFSKFQDAINKIDKSCGECHAQYRNG